jgi:hypothetical protein
MKTIIVDDTVAGWIDLVKKEKGIIGYDRGTPIPCDDENAIMYMYIAYNQIKKVQKALQ